MPALTRGSSAVSAPMRQAAKPATVIVTSRIARMSVPHVVGLSAGDASGRVVADSKVVRMNQFPRLAACAGVAARAGAHQWTIVRLTENLQNVTVHVADTDTFHGPV